jgi:hypothetical protein
MRPSMRGSGVAVSNRKNNPDAGEASKEQRESSGDDRVKPDAGEGVESSVSYTTEYRLYADRFSAATRSLADGILGLSVDVHVEPDADPNSHWWTGLPVTNPRPERSDPLAMQIWHAAHDTTPLPNVDIWDESCSAGPSLIEELARHGPKLAGSRAHQIEVVAP